MSNPQKCEFCTHEFSRLCNACPHCGQPGLFPNVKLAGDPEEQAALEVRYAAGVKAAMENGGAGVLDAFRAAIDESTAVMNVRVNEAERLVSSDSEIRATFYGMADTRVPPTRPPDGMDWNAIRQVVDTALFGDIVKKEVRFAALSLDGTGLTSYGACTLACETRMVAHRASIFEGNSCKFFVERGLPFGPSVGIPRGFRSTWTDRAKLCIAKLGDRLKDTMSKADFQNLVMTKGAQTDHDDFVEVHIFGPLTYRALRHVTIQTAKKRRAIAEDLKDRLDELKIPCQVQVS